MPTADRTGCRRSIFPQPAITDPTSQDDKGSTYPFLFGREPALLEDHRAVAVHEDAVLEVPPHGAGEDAAFDLATEAHEVVHRVAVGDVGDVLVDYGAG